MIVALAIGAAIGYYYGEIRGVAKGKAELLAEQQAQLEAAQKKIIEQANPFSEEVKINPFEKVYTNPFGTKVNPFE